MSTPTPSNPVSPPFQKSFYLDLFPDIVLAKPLQHLVSCMQQISILLFFMVSTTMFALWCIVLNFHDHILVLVMFTSFVFLPLTACLIPIWGCWDKPLIATVTLIWGCWYPFLFTWQESASNPLKVCVFWFHISFIYLRQVLLMYLTFFPTLNQFTLHYPS